MIRNNEILAPAGSMESLTAAVNCGADAVYIGGKNFSARQNAVNFDTEELKEAADFCHLHDVKLYVTTNTIIHDQQAKDFEKFIISAAKAGTDAFIVQDMGAAKIIKQVIPDAMIHGSTQMSVHTKEAALFLKENGFKRVVLARELDADTIEDISSLDIETEVFVHGALCMCLSGQCYLSSLIGQRSANRGLCAQPCRLPYSALGKEDVNALSLKDLSLLKHLIKLKMAGVTSFKIEGRMKRPEYVASAVMACVQALDGEMPDMSLLRAIFSRNGFTDGYYTGKLDNMFGVREKEDVTAAAKLLPEIRKNYSREIKLSAVHFKAVVKRDEPATLMAGASGIKAEVTGDIPEEAINKPLDGDTIARQLSKLGGTIYEFGGVAAYIDDDVMLSASSINSMRRSVIQKLDRLKIEKNTPAYEFEKLDNINENIKEELCEIRARVSDSAQIEAAKKADKIIIPMESFLDAPGINYDISKIIIEPPRFILNEPETIRLLKLCRENGAEHLLCNNIAYIRSGKALGYTLHGDFSLNVSNSYSLKFYQQQGLEDITLSFELKLGQISALKKNIKTGLITYGNLPVMLCRSCPIRNEIGCEKCEKCVFDRMGMKNKVICHDKKYIEILNSQPLYMADRLSDINNVSFHTLYFTNESPEQVEEIIKEYINGAHSRNNITRGLYYRGVL